MGIGQWLVYRLRLRWHDLTEYTSDLVKFTLHSKHALAEQTTGTLDGGMLGTKVAIVAIYPTSDIMFSIRNICTALSKSGYSILLVSSARIPARFKDELIQYCTLLFERYGFGRDFGSYAAAIHWLDKQGKLSSLDSLVLANDSMFWPSDFSGEIASLDAVDSEWKCLFEHQKVESVRGHAQSFLLIFRNKLINDPSFRRYWATYTPWSARKKVISQGEVGLSVCLTKAGYHPCAAYTFPRIWSSLSARTRDGTVDQPLKMALYDLLEADLKQLNMSLASLYEIHHPFALGDQDQLKRKVIRNISQRLFEGSPSHGMGMLCNVLLGAPLKRDLCSKYGQPIGDILATVQGFSAGDIDHLYISLLAKGSRRQYNGFEEFMLKRGRL